jgi:YidC/Oxa1 family membrane protein insertase
VFVLANVLQPLIDINEGILKFWHNTVGISWGASIIGLTLVIRFAILPLTYKQVRAMQDMQRFSPEIQKIRDRYKEDKTRQNEELMKLYQEHGFNPLGSCLPLVLQLPFFFGLYQTLRSQHFIDQVHATTGGHFLIIPDITEPLKGHTGALIVMIILYVGSQLGSSYVSSLNVQDKNQRRLLFVFPFVFVPVVINFEAGLLVYWVTTNCFTMCQQLAVRKFLPSPQLHPGNATALKGDEDDAGGPGQSRKRRRPASAGDAAAEAPADGKKKKGGFFAQLAAGAQASREDDAKPAAKAPKQKPAKASSASNGKDGGGPRKAPPPSPRKKKKRTGRRR